MPPQTQMSSFAGKLGARIAAANVEHKDKPIDSGVMRLPPGIRSGVAKLQTMTTKEYTDDKSGLKGQVFFRAAAVVISPIEHGGQKVAGLHTSVIIPLCEVPAKGQRKAKSFSDNWYEFQNLFKMLGIAPPNETPLTDPTGQKIEAYYLAAMRTLTDPQRPPVYITFSTRGWTPPPTPQNPKPDEMLFETWHGLADLSEAHDPAAGVVEQPEVFEEPPSPSTTPLPSTNGTSWSDEVDVATLVAIASSDPNGATKEGKEASARLEELAWKMGWTREQTVEASSWEEVGDMALNPPEDEEEVDVTVGSVWLYAKRDSAGNKIKNKEGQELPPKKVEVVTVDEEAQTCTLKYVKDGKMVVDFRTKEPVAVQWEDLEYVDE